MARKKNVFACLRDPSVLAQVLVLLLRVLLENVMR